MKKFGKKTLSLALAFVMVLSMCTFVSFAAGAETLKIGESKNLTLAKADEVGGRLVEWSTSDNKVVTVENGTITGVAEGTATITAHVDADPGDDTADPVVEPKDEIEETWTVTVEFDENADVTAFKLSRETYEVPFGTKLSEVAAALKKDITVTATYGEQGDREVTVSSWNSKDYDAEKLGTYTFTASITGLKKADGVDDPTVQVTVTKYDASKAKYDLGTVYVVAGVSENNALKALPTTFDPGNGKELTIGSKSTDTFDAWTRTGTFSNKSGAKNTYTAKLKDSAAAKDSYDGLKDLTVVIAVWNGEVDDVDVTAYADGMTMSRVLDRLDKLMQKNYGENVKYIAFTKMNDKGGTLYLDDSMEEEADTNDDGYTAAEFENMFFMPDGTGDTFVIEYEATTANAYAAITGKINIATEKFVVLEERITNTETLDFSIDAIEDALEILEDKTSKDYALISVSGIEVTASNYGDVYVDYDDTAKKNTTARGTYYAQPSKNQASIDSLTFVPNEKLNETVTAMVTMNAKVEYTYTPTGRNAKTSTKTDTVSVVYRVEIVDEADITLYVKNGDYVDFDAEAFVDFLEEANSNSKNKVELAYVEFDGLPSNNQRGHIYSDYNPDIINQYIKNPDGKDYYYSDSKQGDYELASLTYVTGTNKDFTIRVEFTLHYTRGTSKSLRSDVTGTMDIVVGASQTSTSGKVTELYNGAIFRDSDVYNFENTTFGNDTSYVVFTSAPTGGKLVYNFGKANQTDVKLNTNYYTSGTSNALSNVTFVPAYGGALRGVIECKVTNTKNKTTNYRITLTVTRSTASRYFNDVTASSFGTYADSIDLLRNMGITTGTTATTFEPAKTLTRGEWITMLYRAAGSPAVTGSNKFTDVPTWCRDAVQWAVSNGITNGTSATTFSPAQVLTRQEIAQFLYNWVIKMNGVKATNNANLSNYTDGGSVAGWAQDAMKWALGNGYFDAVSGKINPTGNSNRAEAADSLHRLIAK